MLTTCGRYFFPFSRKSPPFPIENHCFSVSQNQVKFPFRTLAYINGIRLFAKTKNAYIYAIRPQGYEKIHTK